MNALFRPATKKFDCDDEFEMTLASLAKEQEKVKALKRKKLAIPQEEPEVNGPLVPDKIPVVTSVEGVHQAALGEKFEVSDGDIPWVRSKNILHKLFNRTQFGQKLREAPKARWGSCPWISLQTATVTCMTWDDQGVLLAAGTVDNRISVWDWDTVEASNIQGRRDCQRDKIEPILTFSVPYQVGSLTWSSTDHLAVGFRGSSEVRIYDMKKTSKHISESGIFPATAFFSCIPSHVPKHQKPIKIVFLLDNHLLVSYPHGLLILWRLSLSSRAAAPVWKWKLQEDILSIAPFTTNWLFLGGSMGSLIWLDWKKCSRKAFGSDKTPTVVATWDTFAMLEKLKSDFPPKHWMGIQTIIIKYNPMLSPSIVGSTNLRWVTASGFAVSMDIRSKHGLQILQAPPKVLTKSSTGEVMRRGTSQYSIPSSPVPSNSTNSGCCCWKDPQQLTHVLPSTDNNVLSQRQLVISKPLTLSWMDEFSRIHRIPIKRSPKLLLVHPSHQWILVANDVKLIILNARHDIPSNSGGRELVHNKIGSTEY